MQNKSLLLEYAIELVSFLGGVCRRDDPSESPFSRLTFSREKRGETPGRELIGLSSGFGLCMDS